MRWAMSGSVNDDYARELRFAAIRANHRHYYDNIPIYRRLADQAEVSREADTAQIAAEMMSTDHIFKSYPQEHLDNHDYGAMNRWLRQVYDRPVDADVAGAASIDDWLGRLNAGRHSYGVQLRHQRAHFVRASRCLHLVATYRPRCVLHSAVPDAPGAARDPGNAPPPAPPPACSARTASANSSGAAACAASTVYSCRFPVAPRVRRWSVRRSPGWSGGPPSCSTWTCPQRWCARWCAARPTSASGASPMRSWRPRYGAAPTTFAACWPRCGESAAARRRTLVFGAPFMIKEFCEWLVAEGEEIALRPRQHAVARRRLEELRGRPHRRAGVPGAGRAEPRHPPRARHRGLLDDRGAGGVSALPGGPLPTCRRLPRR